MATDTKTPSNTWKAVVRKRGRPVTVITLRNWRDAAACRPVSFPV